LKRRVSITYNPESMSVYYILIGTTLSNIVYLYNNVGFSIGYAKMNASVVLWFAFSPRVR